MTLPADVNHPGSQVSNWEAAHSLVEDAVSDAEIAAAPCLPALSVACLPLCLWGWRALYGSWLALLWYLLNPLFCDCSRVHWTIFEPLVRKGFSVFVFVFLCLTCDSKVWFAILH